MFQASDLQFFGSINVDISHNNISVIEIVDAVTANKYAFEAEPHLKLPNQRHFIIEGNPIKCYCKEYRFLEYKGDQIIAEISLIMSLKEYGNHNLICVKPEMNYNKERMPMEYFSCLFKNDYCLNCPKGCDVLYRPSDKSLVVDCHQRNLTSIPEALPDIKFTTYTELILSGNRIKSVKPPFGPGYYKVKKYILSDNKISEIDLTAFSIKLKVCSVYIITILLLFSI